MSEGFQLTESPHFKAVEFEDRVKVLVCGGRTFNARSFVFGTLDHYHEMLGITDLAHGGAKGADTLAGEWAKANGVRVHVFRADWDRFGKSAGYKRNVLMYETFKPDLVLAFPGGKGTAMMAEIASKGGTDVQRF